MSTPPIQPAIRDFPHGSGPFSQRITPVTKGYLHQDQDQDFSAKNLNFVPYDEVGYPSNAKISSGVTVTSYSSQPRVSAIRDFPPLCGLNVQNKEVNHDHKPGCVIKEKVKKHGGESFREKSFRKKEVVSSSRIVSHCDEVSSKFDCGSKTSNVPVSGHGGFDVGGCSNRKKGKNVKEVPKYVGNKFSKKEGKVCLQRKKQEFPNVSNVALSHRNDPNVKARIRVRATLRLFHAACRRLMKEENESSRGGGRADVRAAKFLYNNGKYINEGKHIIGSIPGVEVGDEFQYWKELNIVGIHNQLVAGIGFSKHNGRVIATSVVSSLGLYDDEMDSANVLVYTGQGGNVIKTKNTDKPKDQKLEKGNLALKNSIEAKNPIRVIMKSESKDGSCKIYAYYGLYKVERYWQEIGSHGMLVFKFELRRIPGQLDVPWKNVKKSEKSKMRKGLCVGDISYGKEVIPVCAINTVDDEKPPKFEYFSSMRYPNWYRPIPRVGCDCTSGCTDSEMCACALKNGGKIPFNCNKAIVEAKPKSIVYECGPYCRCPPTCHNRVSQQGIKFQFEIFKTKTKGWGVRSLNTIPSGSFICEYTGELLEEAEAEKNIGQDEYLFDIGNNYIDSSLHAELLKIMPDAADSSSSSQVFEGGGFTINAANYGNIGRFINHSCYPNIFAQNVLYDHGDTRIPHIMLFADMNIPRMQELAYHYNYKIDQVFDSDGNIKKKKCFCGALECTGRMY